MPTTPPGPEQQLLASTEAAMADPVTAVPVLDERRRGAIADSPRPGVVRRAEPGSAGPLVLVATQRDGRVAVEVWGAAGTPRDEGERALDAALDWVGARDDVDVAGLTRADPVLHRIALRMGTVRLSRMPHVQEALGRAVLGALVQRVEASRSVAQLAALVGTATPQGVWTWPGAETIARTPAHAMRRCGISRRAASTLHGGALDAALLDAARDEPARFDRRLRALPGVGVWTVGETRRYLGDPDSVPLGDDSLPQLVCHALTGAEGDDCTDAAMLHLLAPYEGQRGRVVRLVLTAVFRGLLPRHPRRAPRAAVSEHRYW